MIKVLSRGSKWLVCAVLVTIAPLAATTARQALAQAASAAAPLAPGAAKVAVQAAGVPAAPLAPSAVATPSAPSAPALTPAAMPAAPAVDTGAALPSAPGASVPNAQPAAASDTMAAGSPAPSQTGDETALPSSDGVNPRSPGLMLNSDSTPADVGADPFAEPPPPPPKTPEQIEAEIRSRAYDAAVTGLLPLRPGEIRKLLETYDKTQQAVEIPVYPYPKPQVVIQTVSLDPGSQPLEIKVATGHVSTLNVMDVTGAPWPIQDMSWAGNFEIVQPETGGAVLRITPMSEFAYGNISIRLIGLSTPVTFIMKAHRDVVQYRFDARIPQFGPNAKPPVIQGGLNIAAGNSILAGFLEGVAPDGAERLKVDGVDGRTSAYKYASETYVRTPLTLLSPGWSSSVSSGDGMNVYQLRDAPVLLLSEEGEMKRARLSDKDAGDRASAEKDQTK